MTTTIRSIERAPRPQHSVMLHELGLELAAVQIRAIVVTWAADNASGTHDIASRGLGSTAELVYLSERFKQRLISGDVVHLLAPPSEIPSAVPAVPAPPDATCSPVATEISGDPEAPQ